MRILVFEFGVQSGGVPLFVTASRRPGRVRDGRGGRRTPTAAARDKAGCECSALAGTRVMMMMDWRAEAKPARQLLGPTS
eukprot:3307893-Rhodomonas_salina.1